MTAPNHHHPLTALCQETLLRLNLDSAEVARRHGPTLDRLARFAETLDSAHPRLDLPAQIALEDLVAEYAVAAITADRLELAVGQSGDLLDPKGDHSRQHPALAQAAAARSRIRQIHKQIERLLKSIPKNDPIDDPRPGTATAEPEPQRILEPAPTPQRAAAPINVASPAAAAAVSIANTPVTAANVVAAPEPVPADQPPIAQTAPPRNRAERRAQERALAKAQRKAEKRARYKAAAAVT